MAFIRRFRLPLAIAAALLLAYLDLQWVDTYRYPISTPDFFVYYLAAQIGQAQGWLAMYDSSIFLAAVTPIVGRPLPYLNPPELAWLVVPLAALPYPAAAWVWLIRPQPYRRIHPPAGYLSSKTGPTRPVCLRPRSERAMSWCMWNGSKRL